MLENLGSWRFSQFLGTVRIQCRQYEHEADATSLAHGITLVVGNGSVQVSMSATAFDSMDGMVRRLKAKSLRPRTGGLRGTQVVSRRAYLPCGESLH